MGELAIRRNRIYSAAARQETGKTEKLSGAVRSQSAAKIAGHTLSETLQKLLSSVGRAESQIRESRRTLQTGEAVLAEVQDRLGRAAELTEMSAGGGIFDRKAIQAELEGLWEEIDRMLAGASAGDTRLFLDGELDEADALLYAAAGTLSGDRNSALPDWLARGIAQNTFDLEQVLTALGLDLPSSGAEILAALSGRDLDSDPAAGYLAALYLGAFIAGGTPSGPVDLEEALAGLRQLLAKMAEGMPLDEAVELLTDGAFTSLADFQSQFLDGTAPGLEDFLAGLPVYEETTSLLEEILSMPLLAGGGEMVDMDLLMDLLLSIGIEEGETVPGGGAGGADGTEGTDIPGAALDIPETAPGAAEAVPAGSEPRAVLRFGDLQVTGEDLSGVSFDEEAGQLTVSGTADITIQGSGEERETVLLTGSGTVTLQDAKIPVLTITSPEARVFSGGTAGLNEIQLRPGVSLTLGGNGLFRINTLHADASNGLRLAGGAVVLERADETAPLAVPVILEVPASLAARAAVVSGSDGKPLDAFDVVWKTLLPDWSALTAVEVDGRQAKMELDPSLPVRLWLERGDPSSHGHPVHLLAFRGRDAFGRERVRYVYLRWSRQMEAFEEAVMYPNPFTVTGGEAGRDWIYEEESQTLRILTAQVTAVSGGAGMDANQAPFSGRIALADGIGKVELTLEGVACQVSSGRAFSLGRENDVSLFLESGTGSSFESGAGCAGISLGDGTTLRIDRGPRRGGKPAGTLTASGGAGGAGIGRDSGGGAERDSHIEILGGVITAAGNGGGAGIGGGLGTPVGDISIHGGKITAEAAFHAAAIGAGVRGACGDILIDGTARIVKALGGDPGADIGACLFGNCGKVVISGAADIGSARLRRRAGVSLHTGEDALTLPQFRLSTRTLRLDRVSVSTREAALAAKEAVDAGRRLVSQIQDAYSTLYTRLEQNSGELSSVRQYVDVTKGLLRDTAAAGALLEDTRQYIPQTMRAYGGRRRREDIRELLR